jgi:23S rRNA pseudouridine955/2504/2580 synthase
MLEGFAEQLHLHARGLAIPHPEGGVLRAEAPLPPHMRETFAALGFAAPKPIKPARGPARRR